MVHLQAHTWHAGSKQLSASAGQHAHRLTVPSAQADSRTALHLRELQSGHQFLQSQQQGPGHCLQVP